MTNAEKFEMDYNEIKELAEASRCCAKGCTCSECPYKQKPDKCESRKEKIVELFDDLLQMICN